MKQEDEDISEIFDREVAESAGAFSCYVQTGVNGVHRLGTIQRYDRRFFVKSLMPEYAADHLCRLRLRKEFKLLLELNHPGVIRVYELAEVPGLGLSLLMEYVSGVTLAEWACEGHSRKERRRVADALIDAAGYLHGRGVVHGDLKPANVMVSPDGGLKLIDFGLGDTADYALLKGAGGTRGYSAPEQFEPGYEPSPSADIYALGRMLAELRLGFLWRGAVGRAVSPHPGRRPRTAEKIRAMMRRRRNVAICCVALAAVSGVYAGVSRMWPSGGQTAAAPAVVAVPKDTVVKVVRDTVFSPAEAIAPAVEASVPETVTVVDLSRLKVPDEAVWVERRAAMDRKLLALAQECDREMKRELEGVEPGSYEYHAAITSYYNRIVSEYSSLVAPFMNEMPHEMLNKYGVNWVALRSFKCYPILAEMEALNQR